MARSSRAQLTRLRLAAQWIARPRAGASAADVVRHLTAMQAQDFAGAQWSVALRTTTLTEADVEAAIADHSIVRSWPMRGTLHFVAPQDLGWILQLTGERGTRAAAGRHRQLELDENDFDRAADVAREHLSGGRLLTRPALLKAWDDAGISTAGQRGAHLLVNLSQKRVLVFGPRDGKQHTFTLLDDWVTAPRRLEGDEALGEFARRYFASHGPATVRDFAWWSSLTLTQARAAVAIARPDELIVDDTTYYLDASVEPARGGVHLLPGFDEYLLGYQDRTAALAAEHFERVVPGGNGMFMSTVVVDGEVTGLWRRTITASGVDVTVEPFSGEAPDTARAVARYAKYLGR
jgi:hypothetical protein